MKFAFCATKLLISPLFSQLWFDSSLKCFSQYESTSNMPKWKRYNFYFEPVWNFFKLLNRFLCRCVLAFVKSLPQNWNLRRKVRELFQFFGIWQRNVSESCVSEDRNCTRNSASLLNAETCRRITNCQRKFRKCAHFLKEILIRSTTNKM